MLNMLRSLAIIGALLLPLPAAAQQQPQSLLEKALSDKLMDEINANIQARMDVARLKAENAQMKKALDALKPPPTPEDAK